MLASTGAVTVAVVGAVVSSVKLAAVPVRVFPALSVTVACTVYVPSLCDTQLGIVTPLVHVAAVLLVVALWVVARLEIPACQAEPFQ